jgi:hypothetical protein
MSVKGIFPRQLNPGKGGFASFECTSWTWKPVNACIKRRLHVIGVSTIMPRLISSVVSDSLAPFELMLVSQKVWKTSPPQAKYHTHPPKWLHLLSSSHVIPFAKESTNSCNLLYDHLPAPIDALPFDSVTICLLFWVLLSSFFVSLQQPTHPIPILQLTIPRYVVKFYDQSNPAVGISAIAASLYDPTGELARGAWGSSILQLITLLGEGNVFVSIYENEIEHRDKGGPRGNTRQQSTSARLALEKLSARIPCNKSIVYERLDLDQLPTVVIPATGEKRVKRITYLAETRNLALRPFDSSSDSDSDEIRSTMAARFDKLLFLNDMAFDPIDALQFLFSTNADSNGVAQYRAASAVDFINPFKFYDTYTTRDLEGYSMGLPFFPWFSSAGSGRSRKAVLAGSDNVPVRSCWGGMVAFDARYFQNTSSLISAAEGEAAAAGDLPARFRALTDPDYRCDASKCCLIHADIQRPQNNDGEVETGVYMNPLVRVAYDTTTLSWLSTTRRVERLYAVVQRIGNYFVGLPWFNPRREDQVGGFDGFCGCRGRGFRWWFHAGRGGRAGRRFHDLVLVWQFNISL